MSISNLNLDSSLIIFYRYDLNDVNGTQLLNVISQQYDATLVNGATISSSNAKVGNASLLLNDSSGQYLTINSSINSFGQSSGDNGLTFSFWCYNNNTKNNNAGGRIFFFSDNNNSKRIQFLVNNTELGGIAVSIDRMGDNFTQLIEPITSGINTWRHYTLTMTYATGSTSVCKVYVNGALTQTFNNALYPENTDRSLLLIGNSGYGNSFFNGNIDDFRVYKRVLTNSEILRIYNSNFYPYPCFKEGSKILTIDGYVPIEKLRKGDLVQTLKNSYLPITIIGKSTMYNSRDKERIKDRLYTLPSHNYPDLTEDLVLTGCHSILMDKLTLEQEKAILEKYGGYKITDGKVRLETYLDTRAQPYKKEGNFTIYHLALENNDYYGNYGIWANGLLVESCSKRYLAEISNMELI